MRITFVIFALDSGGAQRVMSTMANHWVACGRQVTIITVTGKGHDAFYPLSPGVHWIPLNEARPARNVAQAMINNFRRLYRLRRRIRQSKPDVVISFLDTTNVLTLVATRATRLPVIVEEHTDPNLSNLQQPWKWLRAALYPRATRVIVLSESSKRYFSTRIRRITEIIPNPVRVDPMSGPVVKSERPHVVSMGRFGPEKGFDQLIDAFALIADRCPCWDLVIWGEGNLRAELTAQIDRLGLTGRVRLPGNTVTPHDELRKAQIYALPSRREGFPMALAEGMACGLAAVAFDLPSGPKAIIRAGVDGLLVPMGDIPALADALASLIMDERLRSEMSAKAPDVLERYGVAQVMAIWDDLLVEVATRR